MNMICVPLDIRPYNYDFLISLASMDSKLSLKMPAKDILGYKKQPASHQAVDEFINSHCADADALIISLDMYLYGGLFPARIHQMELSELTARLNKIKSLKERYPSLKIYASSLVLRTPKYNSSEEEPDYYARIGHSIFQVGYLSDKEKRVGLSEDEKVELRAHHSAIDSASFDDWLSRRSKNLLLIEKAIELVDEKILEQLIIPLDDTAEFGFTMQDQVRIYEKVSLLGVQDRVFVHPGTDESGCTLLTKAYLSLKEQDFLATTFYSNELFKHFIPNYEDRPFVHSLRSHAAASGLTLVDNDVSLPVLAINGCGEIMQEAFDISYGYNLQTGARKPTYKNITYYTHRDLGSYAKHIAARAARVPVVVIDVAMSNGGETELVRALDKAGALDVIKGYAGWNTTCNSLGTGSAHLVFSTLGDNADAIERFYKERLISDWAYQTEVRFPVQFEYLPSIGLSYSSFAEKESSVFDKIKTEIENTWQENIKHSFNGCCPAITSISAPFQRMSGLHFTVA